LQLPLGFVNYQILEGQDMTRAEIERQIKQLTNHYLMIKWSRLKKHDAEKSLLPTVLERIKNLKAKLQAIESEQHDV